MDTTMMKTLITALAAFSLALTLGLGAASAQVQPYRPAPRGNDPVPLQPLILGTDSPANLAGPNCTGSARCNDFRTRRPIIAPTTRTQAQICQDRYQSYRAFDNTYQPLSGPRRTCTLQ
ncbi:TPA: BA14K family protein [Escherichia coli]|nr:BA14K family protein [Escherichia coli]